MEYTKPTSINIETISVCNLNCVFCNYKNRKDRKIMPELAFKVVIHKLVKYGIKKVRLTPMTGELFLDPLLFNRLDYLREREVSFSFFTNFIEFDKRVFDYDNLDTMHISIYGHDEKSFCELTNGTPKQYEKLCKNLEYLIENDLGSKIWFVVKDHTQQFNTKNKYFSELWRYLCRLKNAKISSMEVLDNWGGEVKDLWDSRFMVISQTPRKTFCPVLLNKNIILWDGAICACGCRDINRTTQIGDAVVEELDDIFLSEKYLNMLKNPPEICTKCSAKIYEDQ